MVGLDKWWLLLWRTAIRRTVAAITGQALLEAHRAEWSLRKIAHRTRWGASSVHRRIGTYHPAPVAPLATLPPGLEKWTKVLVAADQEGVATDVLSKARYEIGACVEVTLSALLEHGEVLARLSHTTRLCAAVELDDWWSSWHQSMSTCISVFLAEALIAAHSDDWSVRKIAVAAGVSASFVHRRQSAYKHAARSPGDAAQPNVEQLVRELVDATREVPATSKHHVTSTCAESNLPAHARMGSPHAPTRHRSRQAHEGPGYPLRPRRW